MMPGDEKVVGERLYAVLSNPPKFADPEPPASPSVTVSGQWEARLEFGRGTANHTIVLEQDGSKLLGTHHGEFYEGDLSGTVSGNQVRFRTSTRVEGTRLSYEFMGTVDGDKIAGTVNLGEYGQTTWSAQKHKYQTGGNRRNG
jgi:L-seryl-tRNA(Ser) seleniumtransferase